MNDFNGVDELWIAAYRAGYDDARHERDYDPGLAMPDTLAGYRLEHEDTP
jgi:hypothetical protein